MTYGIQITYRSGKHDWCLAGGQRLEFDTLLAAQDELKDWKLRGWMPRSLRYVAKEIP